jgi:hypothetical protein
VDVDDALREAAQERGVDELHVAGEDDELDAGAGQPVGHRRVARAAVRVLGDREDAGGDTRGGGALERAGAGLVGADGDDLDALAAVDAVEDRLEVGALAGGEDADLHAASSTG